MSTHLEREDDGQGVLVPDRPPITIKTKVLHAYDDVPRNGDTFKTLCGCWRRSYEFASQHADVTCHACRAELTLLEQETHCARCGGDVDTPLNMFCDACARANDADNEQDAR